MSVILGIRPNKAESVSERELHNLATVTDCYAPDGLSIRASEGIGMGFQSFYRHACSKIESQPAIDRHGNMLTFDGRLDNYRELCEILAFGEGDTTDLSIVLAAFERWGEDCFTQLIGDWALALWDHRDQCLYLARDHAGTRTLFYELAADRILWSTYLETFPSTRSFQMIDEEYAAAFLSMLPIRSLTPYPGIRAVLPGHYVIARNRTLTIKAHWQWFRKDKIRFHSDEEYEDRFRCLFRQSVARRIGSRIPVLAELSGGMDSSSIVCMADEIRRAEGATDGLLDTVSYYNDSEANWNEKPYFKAVEERRGKRGVHIDVSLFERTFEIPDEKYVLPGPDGSSLKREEHFAQWTDSGRYRVILSGAGGDEVLGGVPIPFPELADYLVSGRGWKLLGRATEWSLANRSTLVNTLAAAMRFTVQAYFPRNYEVGDAPPWIADPLRRIAKEHSQNDRVQGAGMHLFPTAICNGNTWWSIMESLPHLSPALTMRYEYRYPYLDRDLVEFLFAIPREQLVRPGRRRSLMRRALQGIVPSLILERRRKAFPMRIVLCSIEKHRQLFSMLASESLLAQIGFIDSREFLSQINSVQVSNPRWWSAITRSMLLEIWLQARAGPLQAKVAIAKRPTHSRFVPAWEPDNQAVTEIQKKGESYHALLETGNSHSKRSPGSDQGLRRQDR
jgi:asparagine synthase (glutamine-hydrolysing)